MVSSCIGQDFKLTKDKFFYILTLYSLKIFMPILTKIAKALNVEVDDLIK